MVLAGKQELKSEFKLYITAGTDRHVGGEAKEFSPPFVFQEKSELAVPTAAAKEALEYNLKRELLDGA